ncbi:MAG TPA: alkaline phosphatase D family protein [Xanthobacteraceae bacterium]|nr:alkaline phosphatase D family protein [Xanthobacteraceae bacterium]
MSCLLPSRLASKPNDFSVNRRRLIGGLAAGCFGLMAGPVVIGGAIAQARRWPADPFSLGIASGAPRPDGFVLWTRLAPDPLSINPATPGGMTGGDVPVAYEIAGDEAMHDIVRRGVADAEAAYGWSVHVDVSGLQPGRPYWYRFRSGDAVSQTGRAMTSIAAGTPVERMRFGFVSCSHYELGYFSAYRHLADENPDMVLFLGDYIYEGAQQGRVRTHSDGIEAATLPTYRNRYAQYRLDADLQRIHAQAPSLVTWDDHEVSNDYADKWSQYYDDPELFLRRRAAAYQAFYEHMPVRPILSRPEGPVMRIYDRFTFGDLLEISMIDGRQYRSRAACYEPPNRLRGHFETDAACPERRAEGRTMLGYAQENWLGLGLAQSKAKWNVIAQDVLMAQLRRKVTDGNFGFWTDDWDGFPASRRRLLQSIVQARTSNPVVIGGDIHAFFANDLRVDFDDPNSPVVATELVGTSISSQGPPYQAIADVLPDNPHVRFFESRKRGYVSVQVDAKQMTAQLRAISDVTDPKASVSTLKTFAVESGKPGVVGA